MPTPMAPPLRLAARLVATLLLCSALGACLPGEGTPDGGDETPDGGDAPGAEGEQWLEAHNLVRARAAPSPTPPLPDLTWSASAAAAARTWADNCRFEHSGARGLGENLYAQTSAGATPAIVVQAWADEASDYRYDSNTCASGKVCGHYTQLVWRDTRQVGCASARCTRNSPFSGFSTWYLSVCNYTPPGNFVGERPY